MTTTGRRRSSIGSVAWSRPRGVVTTVSAVALFALVGMVAGAAGGTRDAVVAGGMVGGLIGLWAGLAAKRVVSAAIEWMCQLLIVHGELVERIRRKPSE